MGVSLDTLPFDVVSRIFYHLSAGDVVRTCQTCKYLRANLEEHHVWLELAAKLCSQNASVARHILPLTARSTDELRTLVAQQTRLDRYWATETAFTNPLPHFRFRSTTLLRFWKILPGGKYLVLIHLHGDVSLQSLVDLNNIHEIANFSLGPRSGCVYGVSLVTDNKDRPLLALCTYGASRRVFFVTLEIETRSINLVRSLKTDFPVIAVAIQHDTVCLCQYTGTFCFVITTLDDTVKKVLSIPQIPIDSTFTYYRICLPTPTTLLLFQASSIRCYRLPDLSELPPGDHRLPELSPIWSWEGPTLPKARLTANSVNWEPGRTTPTVITLLCDFLSHTVTFRPSEKSSGCSHLDVTDHTHIKVSRPASLPSTGITLLQSQKGIWFKLNYTTELSHNFMTFSTSDVQRTGLVRLDISKVGMQERLITAVDFDEVSGRIIVLAKALDVPSYMNYGFVVDVP